MGPTEKLELSKSSPSQEHLHHGRDRDGVGDVALDVDGLRPGIPSESGRLKYNIGLTALFFQNSTRTDTKEGIARDACGVV